MGRTSNLGLPYPEGSDVPDIPRDIGALAQAVDNQIGSQFQDELLLIQRLGAHATMRRGTGPHNVGTGNQWTESGSGYTQIRFDSSDSRVSNVPASVAPQHRLFSTTRNGLVVPYDGIYLPQLNAQFEGTSAFDGRLHVMLTQGDTGTEAEPGGIFINRSQTPTGSYRFSFTGRASRMDAGDIIGVKQEIVSGAAGVLWTFMWVTATFMGDPVR